MKKRNTTRDILGNLNKKVSYKTYQELADITGIARSTISMWFSGKREINVEHLKILSDKFNLSTDYLLYGYSPENFSVGSELNLNDESIDILTQLKDEPIFNKMINEFLSMNNTDLFRFIRNWIEMKFMPIDKGLRRLYNNMILDKEEYFEKLRADSTFYRCVRYSEYEDKAKELFVTFLSSLCQHFYFNNQRDYEKYECEEEEKVIQSYTSSYPLQFPELKEQIQRELHEKIHRQ